MNIFPHYIVRISGQSLESLNELELRKTYLATLKFIDLKNELSAISSILCDILYKKVPNATSKNDRQLLIETKRDIYNKRAIATNQIRLIQKYSLSNQREILEKYLLLRKRIKALKNKIGNLFNNEIHDVRENLKSISNNENFKNGLLLSSYDFFKLAKNKYWNNSTNEISTSYLSIEEGLAKYFSRMCAKTSPFSTFTTISFGTFDINDSLNQKVFLRQKNEKVRIEPKSIIRINHFIYKYLKILLSDIPNFLHEFNIKLNPTLELKNGTITFFTHQGRTESVQDIKVNTTLLAIISFLRNGNNNQRFKDLFDFVINQSQNTKEEVEIFIARLIKIGLIDSNINNIEGNDPEWYIKLQKWLASISPIQLGKELIQVLALLENSVQIFSLGSNKEREVIILKAYKKFKKICNKLSSAGSLNTFKKGNTKKDVSNKGFYEYDISKKFPFSPKDIFYEDVKTDNVVINKKIVEDVIKNVEELLNVMSPFEEKYRDREQMKAFFISEYGKKGKVKLLSYYKDYLKFKSSKAQKNDKLSTYLWEKYDFINNDHLLISINDIKKFVNENKDIYNSTRRGYSQGIFLQIILNKKEPKAVINKIYPGFGKMFSRFLNHQGETETKIIEKLYSENEELMQNDIWAENRDSSYFNANLHPPLLPFEISFPGSNNLLKKEKQIPISNLLVEYDDKRKELVLTTDDSKSLVYVFDLCFQAQAWRSELYQLLSHFTFMRNYSLDVLLIKQKNEVQKIFEKQRKEKEFEIIIVPRIEFLGNVIIQRKSWFIPKPLLPVKKSNESDHSYFIRLNEWRLKNELPKNLFAQLLYPQEILQLEKKILNDFSRDSYKPQYISFDNPFLVNLFSSIIKKTPRVLKLTEMLPNANQLLEIGGNKMVTEFFFQWTQTNKKLVNYGQQ